MQAHEQKSQYLDRFHMVTLSVMPLHGLVGTPLYRLYRYVRRQRLWFFSRFGLNGINFDHFGLK